jgi:hypothetical protein
MKTEEIIKVRTVKGSHPRRDTNWEKYRENYDLIFGAKRKKETENNVRAEPSQPK